MNEQFFNVCEKSQVALKLLFEGVVYYKILNNFVVLTEN